MYFQYVYKEYLTYPHTNPYQSDPNFHQGHTSIELV